MSFVNASVYDTDTSETNSYASETECDFIGFMDKLTDDEMADAEIEINDRIDEYITANMLCMSSPEFIPKVINEITEELFDEWLQTGICEDEDEEELREWVETLVDYYLLSMDIPERQTLNDELILSNNYIDNEINAKLAHLSTISQHDQKSMDWHVVRQNLITASNAWKALSTDAQKNSLIYEKCKPSTEDITRKSGLNKNLESTLHWGQKYEPVSIALYEKKTGGKVGEYGCIVHPNYSFLGASPDGIVVEGERRGRMVEVKNIVNRNITGVPLDAYWIQMQIQMEVCDLDECDFIETRFKECANADEFYYMVDAEYAGGVDVDTLDKNKFGVMALFYSTDGLETPLYKYMPLMDKITRKEVNAWLSGVIAELEGKYTFYMKNYWYLDEYSCVLVKRNRAWFASALPKLEELWKTVEYERVSGYEHRMPKKKVKNGSSQMHANLFDCLLLGNENLEDVCATDEFDNTDEYANIKTETEILKMSNFHICKLGHS